MSISANDQMLEMFLFEMSSLLDQLDEVLLNSEKNQSLDEESVGEIFRIMHTIKGSSAMMEFNVISTVTHRLEDTFFWIRDNGIPHEHFTELFDLMLDATDFLKSQLEAIQEGQPLAEGNDEMISRAVNLLEKLNGSNNSTPVKTPTPGPQQEKSDSSVDAAETSTETVIPEKPTCGADAAGDSVVSCGNDNSAWKIDVLFEEDCGMENLRAFMLITTLRETCNILEMHPSDIETNPDTAEYILLNGFNVIVETDLGADELQQIVDGSMHVKSTRVTTAEMPQTTTPDHPQTADGAQYECRICFEDDCGMENLRAFMLVNSLRASCRILQMVPADIESNPTSAAVIVDSGFTVSLETSLSFEELKSVLEQAMYVKSVEIKALGVSPQPLQASPVAEPVKGRVEVTPAPADDTPNQVPSEVLPVQQQKQSAQKQSAGKPIKQNLINVSLSKLDELMDLMGELVITESMVVHSPDLKGLSKTDSFQKAARQLQKLTGEMQDMVMSIRMVPVAGTFQKMQRIVRDMCRALGKDADLVTMGEDTDIDKTIIDGIADPIMHLVRNSMDHGVETPEERVAAGKPAKATVTLSAQNTGGEILITVSDDGKGLDAEKLLEKAAKNGILTKPASEYTEKEAYMLLCAPGFSTKEQVTEFSGRGVGMDVVKKNIEKIGGTVVIESKKGYGMSVFLKIPLTLAIVDGMDISIGSSVYTLQITAINESFKATQDQVIVDTDGNEMIVIRGNVYPIIRLYELYDIPDAITEIENGILIWVQSGDRSICLFVDQLIGEQQIVVKPMPKYLQRYDFKTYGISGCTILGDGNISLILDVGAIIEKVMEKR